MFLFHGLSFYILEKNGGLYTNYLSGGPNLTPPQQILRLIQYKTLRSAILCHLYNSLLLDEVILHYMVKKEEEKTIFNKCPAEN